MAGRLSGDNTNITFPSVSSVSISEALCCISKIASSQKSTKHSIFSLSPPSLMVA